MHCVLSEPEDPSTAGVSCLAHRSVVDPGGRVHGLANVRVADASIMPDIVRANTHLSSIVIGENIAHKIRLQREHEGSSHEPATAATALVARL